MWLCSRGDAGATAFLDSTLSPPLRIRWERNHAKGGTRVLTDGRTVAVSKASNITGIDMDSGQDVWEFQGRQNEFDLGFWTSTKDALLIYTDGRLRCLDWGGQMRWERRPPRGLEEAGADCVSWGRYWAASRVLIDTRTGEVIWDLRSAKPDELYHAVGFAKGLLWCTGRRKGGAVKTYEILGIDPVTQNEAVVIRYEAERSDECVFTEDFVLRGVSIPCHEREVFVWSAKDGHLICRIPISVYGLCAGHGKLWAFNRQDADLRLFCYDLNTGAKVWESPVAFSDAQWPIATTDYIWVPHRKGRKSILTAVDSPSGEPKCELALRGYSHLVATSDRLLAIANKSICCLEPCADETRSAASRAGSKPQSESMRHRKTTTQSRTCVKRNRSGEYALGKSGTLLLRPPPQPKTLLLRGDDRAERVLADGLDGDERYMSALDVLEAAETAAIGLKVLDGARLLLLQKGLQQTVEIDELTCIEVLLNEQGTQVACSLITTDGEVGDATLRVYDTATGKTAHEVSLEPDSLLAMSLRWVDDSHIAFRNEEAGDEEEEWYVWDLSSGKVDAV